MAHRRPGAGQAMTPLEQLMERMAAKRVLLERIGRAHDSGDADELAEAERLWDELHALE